jgi:hypothetical protein
MESRRSFGKNILTALCDPVQHLGPSGKPFRNIRSVLMHNPVPSRPLGGIARSYPGDKDFAFLPSRFEPDRSCKVSRSAVEHLAREFVEDNVSLQLRHSAVHVFRNISEDAVFNGFDALIEFGVMDNDFGHFAILKLSEGRNARVLPQNPLNPGLGKHLRHVRCRRVRPAYRYALSRLINVLASHELLANKT